VPDIRRSILWVSISQYVNLAVGVVSTWLLSRLLTPAEFGVSVLGWAVFNSAESVREFASGALLIREGELSSDITRTSATINVLITFIVTAGLLLLAGPLAYFFAVPDLEKFLYVVGIAFALGAIFYPQQALMSREQAFGKLGMISTAMTLAGSVVSVALAYYGFAALSFAWGTVALFTIGAVLCTTVRWDISIYKPSLRSWRRVLGFGVHNAATAIISRIAEVVPVLVFGKIWTPVELAIASRAVLVSAVAERVVFGPVLAVALPEFSRQVREGRDLKFSYLRALSLISVVHWPGMFMISLLARPIVLVVMGDQWLDSVPLIRIYCPALIFAVPVGLQYAVLSAAGGIKILPPLIGLQSALMITVFVLMARHGLEVIAWSMYPVFVIGGLLSLLAVRSRIMFAWRDLAATLTPSILVTFLAIIGPLAIFLSARDMTPLLSCATILTACLGWILGLYISSHPMWSEVCRVAQAATYVVVRNRGERR
jgi:O-antigen/teichoic acid export membrane protein